MKSTGLLEAYESVIASMVNKGWPKDTSVYEHAAYELLRWNIENMDRLETKQKMANPGTLSQPMPLQLSATGVNDQTIKQVAGTSQKNHFADVDSAATIAKYREQLKEASQISNIDRIQPKSRRFKAAANVTKFDSQLFDTLQLNVSQKQQSQDVPPKVKLPTTKTNRATTELTFDTLEAHRQYYDHNTYAYDFEKQSALSVTQQTNSVAKRGASMLERGGSDSQTIVTVKETAPVNLTMSQPGGLPVLSEDDLPPN